MKRLFIGACASVQTMRPRLSRSAVVFSALSLFLAGACATGTGDEAGEGGSGPAGSNGRGGTGGSVNPTGIAGSPGLGGSTGIAGSPVAGAPGKGGTTGIAGSGEAGAPGGSTGTGGSGPAGAGGSAAGAPGKGGSTGVAGGAGGSSVGGGPGTGGGTPAASGLPLPPGAGGVARPSGTPGTITVLNWAGFKSAVSYTFDDSNSSQISNYSKMNALGVPFTYFMWTNKSDASNSIWATAVKDHHEIGNHTKSHDSNGTAADIDAAQTFIKDKYGVTAWTLAAPNGASVYTQLANGHFMINRGVSDAIIAPNSSTDPFTLPTFIPPTGAATSAFNNEVDSARTSGGWRTMCIHGFTGGSDNAYQPVPIDNFIASVQHTKDLGDVWIGTLTDVGAYWRGQKAFSSATMMTSGDSKTWTWKLPGNFPPGKFLRVKVEGGTLTQSGKTIPWNDHGFYEIALDALSVTLAP
jgi:peptidoglycan/xylan/chitin deacetylase (PgdA/CDA1 family)